jgi:hypothetical protein
LQKRAASSLAPWQRGHALETGTLTVGPAIGTTGDPTTGGPGSAESSGVSTWAATATGAAIGAVTGAGAATGMGAATGAAATGAAAGAGAGAATAAGAAAAGSIVPPHTAQKRYFGGLSAPQVEQCPGAVLGTSSTFVILGAGVSAGPKENAGASGRERRVDSGPEAEGAFRRLPQSWQ